MFNTLFFQPLYNALIALADIIPGYNLGWSIVGLTLIVKIILLPLYYRMAQTQQNMKLVGPELEQIKSKYATDKQEQARQIMELYRRYKINPFMSFLILLIQLPIVIALFFVFKDSLVVDTSLLYSFVSAPPVLDLHFLGIFDVAAKSIPLAIIVGITQFIQTSLALPPTPPRKTEGTISLKDEMARSLNLQMRYFLPVFIVFVASSLPSAVSLYWIVSNLFTAGQEWIVRRHLKKMGVAVNA